MKTKNKIRFIQVGCREVSKPDYGQARAVLTYKPDIILLEYPQNNRTPGLIFNKYPPHKKPLQELERMTEQIREVAKSTHPWAISDITMYENVAKLWDGGKQVYLYAVDGPSGLTRIGLNNPLWDRGPNPLPKAKKHIGWWVKMYLRERVMTQYVQSILEKHKGKDLVVCSFIEKFHWVHVLFLLKNPSRKEIWNYYFGFWKGLTPEMLGKILKEESPELYKFWKLKSEFLV